MKERHSERPLRGNLDENLIGHRSPTRRGMCLALVAYRGPRQRRNGLKDKGVVTGRGLKRRFFFTQKVGVDD